MTVLSARELAKTYFLRPGAPSRRAVDSVSLEIEKGEFVAVMGPSGSGKTTLLNMIALIDKPDSGELRIRGTDALGLRGDELAEFRRASLGLVFQDSQLIDTLTLGENVALPLALGEARGSLFRPRGIEGRGRENAARVASLATALGIAELLGRYPSEVSGGERQRAAAARALACKPALLLADEPTGALDSRSGRELMERFRELNATEGSAVLMTTHDPFAASWATRVVFLFDGRIFTELRRVADRKGFFDRIIEVQAAMEGGLP
jgi:ABC-type lipoprotein export system ATPase subunit